MTTFTPVPIRDIFDIPEHVHQGDFVLKLADGLKHQHETLRDYVVTPQLREAFGMSLGLVQSALQENSSKAAYLHGSFGSGKSHFMAVLTMLLAARPEALAVDDLAPVVSQHHAMLTGKKFLVVPYHMVGATSLEAGVFGGYVRHMQTLHPDAPVPALYLSDKLFENAKSIRAKVGDETFFAKLGEGEGKAKWGKMTSGWTAERFEAALAAPPDNADRKALVSRLLSTWLDSFTAVARGDEAAYVPIDEGLEVITQHAKELGYDAVVLFLDELILWLASRAGDTAFMASESAKVPKLVEAASANRPIPLISFIARQRDLRELVGEHLPGAEKQSVDDVLRFWQGRFDVIKLEDRNLPYIAHKRLLRPKSETARASLAAAFQQTGQARQEVMEILLTREGKPEEFEQVYPFSPVLVQALVALSNCLQRERTAIKMMVQLLSNQRNSLLLGDVMPVGDLYDVIVEGGEEPFLPGMKETWDQARKLYRQKFQALLEAEHGITDEAVKAGTAPADKAQAYRTDARLVKTLILAALAPEVEAFKSLTPNRLAALNHGTVRSRIPGREGALVLQKCRNWAAKIGELKIGDDERNPTIALQLVGVDTEAIVDNARSVDNLGNRINKIREFVFEDLRVPVGTLQPTRDVLWRGKKHKVDVVFHNVRELNPDLFAAPEGTWKVIIDFPFDPEGKPADDRAKLDQYKDAGRPDTSTLVWLPAHFNASALADLGKLVILDHVLAGQNLAQYSNHLSLEDRERARSLLDNQRSQLRQAIKQGIREAYGLYASSNSIEGDFELADRFISLDRRIELRPPAAATLDDAFDKLADQAFRVAYPGQPEFLLELTDTALKHVWGGLAAACESPQGRAEVERNQRQEMRAIAEPLKLATMGETHVAIGDHWKAHFGKLAAQHDVAQPTVRQLRAWIHEPQPMALPKTAEDLVIMTYAAQTNRAFYTHGAALAPELGKLTDSYELREEALPDADTWAKATDLAVRLFGIERPTMLSSSSLRRFGDKVIEKVNAFKPDVDALALALPEKVQAFGVSDAAARTRNAAMASALLGKLKGATALVLCERLALAELPGTAEAMAKSMSSAGAIARVLKSDTWETIVAVKGLHDARQADAEALAAEVRDGLAADELASPLEPKQRDWYQRALSLLRVSPPPPPPPIPEPGPKPVPRREDAVVLDFDGFDISQLEAIVPKIQAAMLPNKRYKLKIEAVPE